MTDQENIQKELAKLKRGYDPAPKKSPIGVSKSFTFEQIGNFFRKTRNKLFPFFIRKKNDQE